MVWSLFTSSCVETAKFPSTLSFPIKYLLQMNMVSPQNWSSFHALLEQVCITIVTLCFTPWFSPLDNCPSVSFHGSPLCDSSLRELSWSPFTGPPRDHSASFTVDRPFLPQPPVQSASAAIHPWLSGASITLFSPQVTLYCSQPLYHLSKTTTSGSNLWENLYSQSTAIQLLPHTCLDGAPLSQHLYIASWYVLGLLH